MISPSAKEQMQDAQKESSNDLVFSYLTLRNLIGFSGMLLPLALVMTTARGEGDKFVQPSISDYYYTSNGDVFVVLLSVVGIFLFTYKGYQWKERVLTIIAAVSAVGVSFSPTASRWANSISIHQLHKKVPLWFGVERHFIFAATFFLCIAIICLVYFPKTNKESLKKNDGNKTAKAKRNILYKICGWTIIASLLLLVLYSVLQPATTIPVIFILETVAIEAFGLSWITKGQTLWPDGEHYISKGMTMMKAAVKR
jgi:cell division protein FtsW (lipid II flippase)